MTRGTFFVVTDSGVFSSDEFNGDMYPDGYGKIAFELLRDKIVDIKTFKSEIKKFNNNYFEYDELEFH